MVTTKSSKYLLIAQNLDVVINLNKTSEVATLIPLDKSKNPDTETILEMNEWMKYHFPSSPGTLVLTNEEGEAGLLYSIVYPESFDYFKKAGDS
ncbi:MAG: hypothetical protein KA715_03310 [Xanthomonadaceae bacterium]|nr:hypothetical protein [Xanthomonadaceae bacterium]